MEIGPMTPRPVARKTQLPAVGVQSAVTNGNAVAQGHRLVAPLSAPVPVTAQMLGAAADTKQTRAAPMAAASYKSLKGAVSVAD